jgi:regulatory protein
MKLNFKQGRGNKIHIHIDGEYRMTADSDFVSSLGYGENSEINEEELASLEKAVSSRRAFNKAVDLLSRRDHSERELRQKLSQRGFRDEADEVVEKLQYYGYIDDRKFAESFSKELIRVKHYGKKRIEQELYRKGIDRDIISEVLENAEFDENEIISLIEKKYYRYLSDEKGIKKTINSLLRMGYSYGEIKDALKAVSETEEFTEDFYEE